MQDGIYHITRDAFLIGRKYMHGIAVFLIYSQSRLMNKRVHGCLYVYAGGAEEGDDAEAAEQTGCRGYPQLAEGDRVFWETGRSQW